jgi:hypothetical protein
VDHLIINCMDQLNFRLPAQLLPDVWKADDDWTPVNDKSERKKIQNRLNQRSRRRRNCSKQSLPTKGCTFRVERFRIQHLSPSVVKPESQSTSSGLRVPNQQTSKAPALLESKLPSSSRYLPLSTSSDIYELDCKVPCSTQMIDLSKPRYLERSENLGLSKNLGSSKYPGYGLPNPLKPQIPSPMAQLAGTPHNNQENCLEEHLLKTAISCWPSNQSVFSLSIKALATSPISESARIGQSRSPIDEQNYPLSSDHHLLHLIHYNVFRSLITNKSLLYSRTSFIRVHSGVPIHPHKNLCDGLGIIRSRPGQVLPHSLYPTNVQMNIAHSSWLSTVPFAQLRDNLIRCEKEFDHYDLCNDLFGELFNKNLSKNSGSRAADFQPSASELEAEEIDRHFWDEIDDEVTSQRRGFIVWGEPWDTNNWEVTPGFVKKWPWAIKGCQDLMLSSNRWRVKRDERRIPEFLFK